MLFSYFCFIDGDALLPRRFLNHGVLFWRSRFSNLEQGMVDKYMESRRKVVLRLDLITNSTFKFKNCQTGLFQTSFIGKLFLFLSVYDLRALGASKNRRNLLGLSGP